MQRRPTRTYRVPQVSSRFLTIFPIGTIPVFLSFSLSLSLSLPIPLSFSSQVVVDSLIISSSLSALIYLYFFFLNDSSRRTVPLKNGRSNETFLRPTIRPVSAKGDVLVLGATSPLIVLWFRRDAVPEEEEEQLEPGEEELGRGEEGAAAGPRLVVGRLRFRIVRRILRLDPDLRAPAHVLQPARAPLGRPRRNLLQRPQQSVSNVSPIVFVLMGSLDETFWVVLFYAQLRDVTRHPSIICVYYFDSITKMENRLSTFDSCSSCRFC